MSAASTTDTNEGSIYQGADIKLEAFDRFHKVLNQCNSGVTFSIKDAALLLKQLTPDILRKIIPVISQETKSPKKKCSPKNSDNYEAGVDAEVSKINELKKTVQLTEHTSSIKRPDASRPTRLLSPGSNSCSPVSAAVQALISISAPVSDKTETITNTIAENKSEFDERKALQENCSDVSCESLFVPVSKAVASTTADFGDSAFIPVPKSVSYTSTKEPFEVEEVLFTTKSNPVLVSVSNVMNAVTNCTDVSAAQAVILSQALDSSFQDSFKTSSSTMIPADDPLPNFGLLLASGLPGVGIPGELSNTISFPFTQHLPGSPMHQPSTNQIGVDHNFTQTSFQNTIPQNSTQTKIFANVGVQSNDDLIDNQEAIHLSKTDSETAEDLTLNRQVFRTILPKPSNLSSATSVVSVLPPAAIAANLVTPRTMTNDTKKTTKSKSVQSVAPAQIFTKINSLPQSIAHYLTQQQQRAILNAQNIFLTPSSENLISAVDKNMSIIKKDVTLGQFATNVPSSGSKQEAGRGKLEVASALLSMGTQDAGESSNNEPQSLIDMIKENLKRSKSDVQVLILDNGTLKIDDLVIDPSEHSIETDNFACGRCNKVFTSIIYLIKHIKRVCPDMSQRKWKCDKCSKAFSHPFGLQQHNYTHTGERPYKCDQCTKAFYSSNDLRRHIRTHSGEKPYKCTQCEKSFSTTISLRTHTYTHTGERPHKCPRCTKSFSTSSKLSRHIVTHLDKKPFPCDQCGKRFNRSGDLRKHYKQQHGLSHSLLECDQCHKVFASKICLLSHKENHHETSIAGNSIV